MNLHDPGPSPSGVPTRYRTTPLLMLLLLALVPALGLYGLLVWSDREADAHEVAAQQIPTAPLSPGDPTAALTTSLLDYRRTPESSATTASDNLLADAMEQLYVFVDPRSCVSVAVDERVVTSWNEDVAVIPASTVKLIVAGTAIEALSGDYSFTTSVAAPVVVDGVIDGDLFLIGGGDPVLIASDAPIDDERDRPAVSTSLDALADQVVAAGITSIRGSVVGDISRYDDELVNPEWGPGVAFVDAGPVAGLLVNDGRTVGRSGRQSDPGEAAARELVRLLRDRGVSVANGWDSGITEPGAEVIASVSSPPLEEIVADMLTRSDNDTAEMLVKELGLEVAGEGSTAAGLDVIDDALGAWGVDVDDVELVDGSGLGATNRLTCATLLDVLAHLRGTPAVAGLPVAGRTGTLAGDLVGTAVEGRLVAKTGSLTNPPADADPPEVKALAGYLPVVDDGEVISFSIVLNGPGYVTTDGYVSYWDALVERLAAYPASPDPTPFGPR